MSVRLDARITWYRLAKSQEKLLLVFCWNGRNFFKNKKSYFILKSEFDIFPQGKILKTKKASTVICTELIWLLHVDSKITMLVILRYLTQVSHVWPGTLFTGIMLGTWAKLEVIRIQVQPKAARFMILSGKSSTLLLYVKAIKFNFNGKILFF